MIGKFKNCNGEVIYEDAEFDALTKEIKSLIIKYAQKRLELRKKYCEMGAQMEELIDSARETKTYELKQPINKKIQKLANNRNAISHVSAQAAWIERDLEKILYDNDLINYEELN